MGYNKKTMRRIFFGREIRSTSSVSRDGFIPLAIARAKAPPGRACARARFLTGFTLIELLVVISFTAILSSMMIVYGTSGREQTTLEVEKTKLVQVIARAKSLSISTFGRTQVPCGYGVAFNSASENQSYVLFRYDILGEPECLNKDGELITEIPQVVFHNPSMPFDDSVVRYEILDGFPLPRELYLSGGPDSILFVFFVPPDPTTLIFTASGNQASEAMIRIAGRSRPGLASTITVTKSGQVSFGDSSNVP